MDRCLLICIFKLHRILNFWTSSRRGGTRMHCRRLRLAGRCSTRRRRLPSSSRSRARELSRSGSPHWIIQARLCNRHCGMACSWTVSCSTTFLVGHIFLRATRGGINPCARSTTLRKPRNVKSGELSSAVWSSALQMRSSSAGMWFCACCGRMTTFAGICVTSKSASTHRRKSSQDHNDAMQMNSWIRELMNSWIRELDMKIWRGSESDLSGTALEQKWR